MTDKPTDFVFDSSRIKWKTPEDKAAFEASGSDWADDAAVKIMSCPCTCEDCRRKGISIALRRAKADGWREAADFMDVAVSPGPSDFRAAADKIEKG